LVTLAAATRRDPEEGEVWQHSQLLPGKLPVIAAPPDADRSRTALAALMPGREGERDYLRSVANLPGVTVIADCGRLDPGSAALPVVRAADVLLLISRAHPDDLAHLAYRLRSLAEAARHPALLLFGPGHTPAEVQRGLGVLPLGRVPLDPSGAAVLRGEGSTLRWRRQGPARSAVGRSASRVATLLATAGPRTAVFELNAGQPALPQPRAEAANPPQAPPQPAWVDPALVPGVPAGPVSPHGIRPAPQPAGEALGRWS
jgi:hypothetical protein